MEPSLCRPETPGRILVAGEEDAGLRGEAALKRWRVQTFRVALEVGARPQQGVIRTAADAAAAVRGILQDLDADREHFAVLMLDIRHRLIGFKVVASGNGSAIAIQPREIFRAALLMNAAAIVVAHNHPSGDPEPSGEDVRMTLLLRQTGELVGVALVDHLVVGEAHFVSLRDRGFF